MGEKIRDCGRDGLPGKDFDIEKLSLWVNLKEHVAVSVCQFQINGCKDKTERVHHSKERARDSIRERMRLAICVKVQSRIWPGVSTASVDPCGKQARSDNGDSYIARTVDLFLKDDGTYGDVLQAFLFVHTPSTCIEEAMRWRRRRLMNNSTVLFYEGQSFVDVVRDERLGYPQAL